MTVEELFERFSDYFYKIIYYDETNDIEDCIELNDCNKKVKVDEYINFKNQYDSFNVVNWFFDNYYNTIIIGIKK